MKIHLNSTISTKDTKFVAPDIKKIYTNSKLELSEYMRIHLSLIPQEIIDEYDVIKYVEVDVYIYVEITGTMYGLSQSGCIADQDLQKTSSKIWMLPIKTNTRTLETSNMFNQLYTCS